MASFLLRPIDPASDSEIDLVAERMQLTLMEVVGEERGKAMYSHQWLSERVRWNLDASRCTGAVYVAQVHDDIVAHTILRVENDDGGARTGLFSTTYVAKSSRRLGIADALIEKGESWIRDQGLHVAATNTSETNTPLIRLYEKHQYRVVLNNAENKMLRLAKKQA